MQKEACVITCRQRRQGKGLITVCQLFFCTSFCLAGFGGWLICLFWRWVHRCQLLRCLKDNSQKLEAAEHPSVVNWGWTQQCATRASFPSVEQAMVLGGCTKQPNATRGAVTALTVLPAAELCEKMTGSLTRLSSPYVSSFPWYARGFLSPQSAGKLLE